MVNPRKYTNEGLIEKGISYWRAGCGRAASPAEVDLRKKAFRSNPTFSDVADLAIKEIYFGSWQGYIEGIRDYFIAQGDRATAAYFDYSRINPQRAGQRKKRGKIEVKPGSIEELVLTAKDDRQLQDKVIVQYENLIHSIVRRCLIRYDDPYLHIERNDLVNIGRTAVWRAILRYNEVSSFMTYAYRCIERNVSRAIQLASAKKHEVVNNAKSAYGESPELKKSSPAEHLKSKEPSPLSSAISSEISAIIKEEARKLLNEKEWFAIRSNLLGERSLRELAAMLDLSHTSVMNLRNAVRRVLAESPRLKEIIS